MSRLAKLVFLVHAVFALVLGGLLLVIPGRFLPFIGWGYAEPILARMLGAALLGLAWSSFRGWQAKEWVQVAILVEAEAVFTLLAAIGVLRHLLIAHYPAIAWIAFAGFSLWAIAWAIVWLRRKA